MSDHASEWGAPTTADDRTWAMVAHLACLIGGAFGPLIVLIVFHEKSKYVKYHAMQALLVQLLTGVIVAIVALITCGFGVILLLPVIWAVPAYGAWVASQGQWKGYPLIEAAGR